MRLSLILLLLIGLVIVVAPSRAVGLTCGAYYEDDWDHHRSEYKLEFLTRCIESGNSPNLPHDYSRRGSVHFELWDPWKAIEDLDMAVSLAPDWPSPHNDLAASYKRLGKNEEAIEEYTKALNLKPDFAFAMSNRGSLYMKLGRVDLAFRDLNRAIEIGPPHQVLYWKRANAYASKGDCDRAILDYDQAIRLDAAYAKAYYRRGLCHQTKGDSQRALKDFKKAYTLMPDHPNIRNKMRHTSGRRPGLEPRRSLSRSRGEGSETSACSRSHGFGPPSVRTISYQQQHSRPRQRLGSRLDGAPHSLSFHQETSAHAPENPCGCWTA